MLKETILYYFSPTGGTKKAGETFCTAFAKNIKTVDLGKRNQLVEQADCEVAVFAAPVFGGRIPASAIEKIKGLDGKGKKAVTLAVYGTRAYEDALLELNNAVEECGFEITAAAALIAQHSIVPIVGQGRPDAKDITDIHDFVQKVLNKLTAGNTEKVTVPGNIPYKDHMTVPATPISTAVCNKCGACEAVCPTSAIHVEESGVVTDLSKCVLCMACIAHCPKHGRILPPPMQEGMNAKLAALKDIRRDNEYFL